MPEPDSTKIDAWLAGKLTPEEEQELQASLEPPVDEPVAEGLLLDLDLESPTTGDTALLDELVDCIKTRSPGRPTMLREDSWRDLLGPSDEPGSLGRLGPYEVTGHVASGGMAIVLEARDPKLDRLVALKILPPELAAHSTARARFLREARSAAKLEHENILPIYSVHENDYAAYFAMRFVPTGTVQDALDRGEIFNIGRLKSIARGVAAALDAAHSAGIVHRDIKPANILLGEKENDVWVCDFGIARGSEEPSLSYGGSIVGTPRYMSPEQAEGKEIDERSDLFSLGTVLYHCASGDPPFDGANSTEVLARISADQLVPVRNLNRSVPKWFSRVLTKLLEKSPADRFPDAGAVVDAIDGETATPKGQRFAKVGLATVAAAAVLYSGAKVFDQSDDTGPDMPQTELAGQASGFGSLQDAIDAAKDGDIITLPAGETIPVDGIAVAGEKSITLRGVAGAERPRLTTNLPGATGISSASPITFEHLAFHIEPVSRGAGIVQLLSTDATFLGCTFTSGPRTHRSGRYFLPYVIEQRDGGSLQLNGCEIDIGRAIPIGLYGTEGAGDSEPPLASVELRDTTAAAEILIHSRDWSGASRQRIEIKADSVQFSGKNFFQHNPDSPVPELEVAAANSVIGITDSVVWYQTDDAPTAFERFRWRGKNNTYTARNANLRVGKSEGQRGAAAIVPLREFDPETGAVGSPGLAESSVRNAESGKMYNDLQAAINDAPPGATLLLDGEFRLVGAKGKPEHPITLRAAPGGRATIIATEPTEHALFFYASTNIHGIHFRRDEPKDRGLPIIGISARGGDALIEDCHFTCGGRHGGNYRVLGMSKYVNATVRRCSFNNPGGHSILTGTESRNLDLEECLFIGKAAIEFRCEEPSEIRARIAVNRCVARSNYFATNDHYGKVPPIDFKVEDSLLDHFESLIELSDYPLERLSTDLTWVGHDNHYRRDTPVFISVRTREESQLAPFAITTFDELRAASQESRESDPRLDAPFDSGKLRSPITPGQLAARLNSENRSEFLPLLKKFSSESRLAIDADWKVEIAGTGERFATIKDAVASATDGATLLLRGRHEFEKPFVTPRGRKLNFRPAEGATPTIVATSATEHGLFINGPATVSGINFSRHDAGRRAMPILGIHGRGGDALVQDCHFQTRSTTTGSRCLSLTNCRKATVRDCEFHAADGTGIILACLENEDFQMRVNLQGCLFTGGSALQQRSISDSSSIDVNVRECTAVCDYFQIGNTSFDFVPMRLAVADSILDTSKSLIGFPDFAADNISDLIVWTGFRNWYREESLTLETIRIKSPAGTGLLKLRDFAALNEVAPQTRDVDGNFGTPVHRDRLRHPVTPGFVLRALDPTLVSPAVEALRELGGEPPP